MEFQAIDIWVLGFHFFWGRHGMARWRVPLFQSLSRRRQATMRRPDCRMTQGKDGQGPARWYTRRDCGCDFRVLLCTGRKNSTVWNYGKEVCQCIPNIVIFKYEICMKHVWNMYGICMAYVQFTPSTSMNALWLCDGLKEPTHSFPLRPAMVLQKALLRPWWDPASRQNAQCAHPDYRIMVYNNHDYNGL